MISVVIPARNAVRFVAKAVQSAFECGADEVVVVDHASTDGTYEAVPGRARVVTAPEGGGPARAKNIGLRASRGDLVTFLDADDILTDLEERACALDNQRVVFGRIEGLIDQDGAGFRDINFMTWVVSAYARSFSLGAVTADRVATGGLPGYATMMYQRKFLEEVGPFDESLDRAEDFDLAYRCALLEPIGFVNAPCYLYRIHDANSSVTRTENGIATRPETRAAHRRALEKHGLI